MVKPDHWPEGEFVVVERIEFETFSVGKAFGYPVSQYKPSDRFHENLSWRREKTIPLASEHSWELVIANYKDLIVSESVPLLSSTGN